MKTAQVTGIRLELGLTSRSMAIVTGSRVTELLIMDGAVPFSIRDVTISDHLSPLREQISITHLGDSVILHGQVNLKVVNFLEIVDSCLLL